ncbi:MAG: histidine phosphatase family protein [Mojavia pulchra JT2-VF2]|jgi:broad specificity phosphatase PhoE|uniref:Histidine phosphatase family protein n=1 Tax=Mojavia pulchra JT2-VF2 TaxID=287848 RepID=A0A951Q5L1_9NOST|nr:histidine phosphatase family protein [Mojavia pulchra JT2-VF2]
MLQRVLHLVRHGQIDLTTRPPTPKGWLLTPLGREQAQLTGLRLSALPISTLHCSTYPRALETAQIIAAQLGNIPINSSALLCECVPGLPQHFREWFAANRIEPLDKDKYDIPANIRPYLNMWTHYVDFEAVAAGEIQSQQAFEKYFQPPKAGITHEVIVSHGNLLGSFLCRLLNLPIELWLSLDMYNCAISEVRIDADGTMRLLSFNDAGHLSYTMRTDNNHFHYYEPTNSYC